MRAPDLHRSAALGLGAALALAALGAVFAVSPASAAEPSDSARTVSAKDYDPDYQDSPFPDLKVTVSQTEDLIQQGITVSWTGGKQSSVPTSQTGGRNYLQVAQCWGDEAGSNGTRPDRTTCQYGGLNVSGDSRYALRETGATIADQDTRYTAIGTSFVQPTTTAIPFVAVNGETVASIVDGQRVANPPNLNNNDFFTRYTTNEVAWAGFGANGSGSVKFEIQTAQQAPGLGCGERLSNGSGRSCWLVVIPRGESDVDHALQTQSGLIWQTWRHHIAVRLDFKPAGVSCSIGAAERQLSGSELISSAMGQWQPKLCNSPGGAIYSLLTGPEADAAQVANDTDTAPMAITTRPLSADGGADHLAYAPVALTGASIAFAIDRSLDPFKDLPEDLLAKQNLALSTMRLTPRLLAKLLTASYLQALPVGSDKAHLSGVENLTKDPDFLAINDPEWASMSLYGPGIADLQIPLGRSDIAHAVWSYILADAEARAFLDGKADPWGMKVNPYYSSNKKVNPGGVGLVLPRDDFPKADPSEYPGTDQYHHADAVNLVTYRPYTSSFDTSAYLVLRGDAQELGDWDPNSSPPKYGKGARAVVGTQRVMAVTDTSSADKYQIVEAALLNSAGKYVTPTTGSLVAAAAAMVPTSVQSTVLTLDPASAEAKKAIDAYPLAMPVYAAANPGMTDAKIRADYAAFITFAVTDGQTPGTGDGELPGGYAPLPKAWRTQALAAAQTIKRGGTAATPTPTATSSSSSAASGSDTRSVPDSGTSGPTGPAASGEPAGSLTGSQTPADPGLGPLTAVVPATAALGVAAALGVPLATRLGRRRR